jgi:pyridoxamine 5'-phosphate oxidase
VNKPIEKFQADRARARDAGDPMAAVCVLATVDEDGRPEARTLVLRQVEDDLALFMHTSSPKWQQLQHGGSINTYWPSVEIQYRMHFTALPIDQAVVAASWQYRPDTPKRMDWFYDLKQAQSTPIGSRDELKQGLDSLSLPQPITAPKSAGGLLLKPTMLERLDLNELSGLHDRRRYTLVDVEWQEEVLVP